MRPLVVVDVQPDYCSHWSRTGELMDAVARHSGPVTMLVNAEETGVSNDTVGDCVAFWAEHGLDDGAIGSLDIVDKGFGYLRPWMDLGADEATIVNVLKHMLAVSVSDSRDLGEDALRILAGDGFEHWMLDEPLSLGWIDEGKLRAMDGCLLCGGGKDECLREVELLLRAHGVSYELLPGFVYGPEAAAPAPRRRAW